MVSAYSRPAADRVIKLAPGIRLSRDEPQAMLLIRTAQKVHLNRYALSILELCDGSRGRERIVAQALLGSMGSMRAADVMEFLDAVQARGWIVEDG